MEKSIVLTDYDPRAAAEEGAKLFILDEQGVPTNSWIKLKGADSDTYQEALRELQRKRNRELNKSRRMKLFLSPDEVDADTLELQVVATEEWGEIYGAPGQALPCNVENARKLYRARPDIREQVDLFINDRANFLPSAVKA